MFASSKAIFIYGAPEFQIVTILSKEAHCLQAWEELRKKHLSFFDCSQNIMYLCER